MDSEALEQELRQSLAGLDAQREQDISDADERLQSLSHAQGAAGAEFNTEINAGQAAVDQAVQGFNQTIQEWDTQLATAQATIEQIGTPDAHAQINAIGHVIAPTVPTSGSPDVAAVDVNAVLNSLANQVNEIRDVIVNVLQIFDSAGLENVKPALQRLTEASQSARNQSEEAIDTETEKATTGSLIDGMYP